MKAYFREIPAVVFQWQGRDVPDFLHRLSTVGVKTMQSGEGKYALFLSGTSEIIATFFLYREEKREFEAKALEWKTIVEMSQLEAFRSHIEKMHFSEDIQYQEQAKLLTQTSQKFFYDWRLASDVSANSTMEKREDENFWEIQRILQKIPKFSFEWQPGTKALDAGMERWIDRNKGCYPGQEVVEKSLNVGHPAKALILLKSNQNLSAEIGSEKRFSVPLALYNKSISEEPIGKITSICYSPENKQCFALAVVQWGKRELITDWVCKEIGMDFYVEKE